MVRASLAWFHMCRSFAVMPAALYTARARPTAERRVRWALVLDLGLLDPARRALAFDRTSTAGHSLFRGRPLGGWGRGVNHLRLASQVERPSTRPNIGLLHSVRRCCWPASMRVCSTPLLRPTSKVARRWLTWRLSGMPGKARFRQKERCPSGGRTLGRS